MHNSSERFWIFRTIIRNIKYVLIHKWFFFCEAMRMGMPLVAITHDLSKFSPVEFVGYCIKFHLPQFSGYFQAVHYWRWEKAYKHHIAKNKHHWNHWLTDKGLPIIMPEKYILQMLCDWEAMGRVFGDNALEYYRRVKNNMILHPSTRKQLEKYLRIYYGSI